MRTIDLKIQDIAFGGKGVGRDQGKAVFVPCVIEGELVSAEVVREKKSFAEAELIEVKESSDKRVQPSCPYFGRCGGCAYQHMGYAHQLATKERQVGDILRRIGGIKDAPLKPIVASPEPYAYRNRITVHVQDGVIGFFRRDSHRLLDVERCPIARDQVNRELSNLRASNPRDGHYTLRVGHGARVFTQTNDAVAATLRDLIDSFVPPDQDLLLDAHCGAGFFAKGLLSKFERVIGIDWDRFAIAEARKNATEKEKYIAGDIDIELEGAVRSGSGRSRGRLGAIAPTGPVTLIVDPPATGLTGETRKIILDLAPSHFVYVSCNPSTLARDLKELAPTFSIHSITPLDMFPQTAEIEVAAFLQTRREAKV